MRKLTKEVDLIILKLKITSLRADKEWIGNHPMDDSQEKKEPLHLIKLSFSFNTLWLFWNTQQYVRIQIYYPIIL